ncbi:methyltransferase family protein [Bogoriella caseilytica]|uniref:Methyltransferase family protein n=1 Tax=Bogoriella caseilytica TaxID=56055 RepID=A0A3N2BGM4_9MICO|nr:methyltransferase family protein [Bogoriella caseilytica]
MSGSESTDTHICSAAGLGSLRGVASRDDLSLSFGAAAGAYEAGRPSYPAEAVAWLLEPAAKLSDQPNVIDVGAGTGKLTRAVIERGAEVTAVEPDPEMLAELHAALPQVPCLVGTAERMPVPDASAEAVVAGQAWHWVDPVAASRECGRVLRPGGVLGLVWNVRDTDVEWVRRLGEIMHGSAAEQMIADDAVRIHDPFGTVERNQWRWERSMTRAQLLSMVQSRSYVITAAPERRAAIETALDSFFDEIGLTAETSISLPYVTHAFRALRN